MHKISIFCINRNWIPPVTRAGAIFAILFTFVGPIFAQKSLVFDNTTYEPQIKTVLCYGPGQSALPAATAAKNSQHLLLEFDDLREEKENYYVRLIHCNYDWSKSVLRDLEILRDYNEFPITDFTFSMNTAIPYVHYRFPLPPVKVAGNYLLLVYRDGNKNDLILTQRVLIFDNQMSLIQNDNLSGLGNLRNTNQALNFKLAYGRIDLIDPTSSVHVIIRQNQRWDNARQNVKPNIIREDLRQMEFSFFDMDNTFSAGNEFRFVDFRSLNSPGQNTQRVDRGRNPVELYVQDDLPRNIQAYAQYADKNGNFSIENMDYRQEPWITANYVNVNFQLRTAKLPQDVYVIGAFNTWAQNDENKLTHSGGAYTGKILLKQGFYDYMYWVKPQSTSQGNQLEGNYFQTENLYDVLVYYRPFQPNADLLVGYFQIPVNPR